jgi:hypothetical protein
VRTFPLKDVLPLLSFNSLPRLFGGSFELGGGLLPHEAQAWI